MRRTVRPNTRRTLLVLVAVLGFLVWVGWELGLLIANYRWWRAVALLASGLTFVMFALGWGSR